MTWTAMFAVCYPGPAHGKGWMFAVCQGFCTRQTPVLCRVPGFLHTANNGPNSVFWASLPCAMVNAHGKEPQFDLSFLSVTYMVPQTLQAFHIYHNKHLMYPKKHRRYLILSRNAQIQTKSSIVHRQSQVVHTSPYNSPYKFMSVLIKSIELTGPMAAAATSAGAAM